jgi:DNA-binding NarL/FixJ family response regulator
MAGRIRVAVFDEHPLFREGITHALAKHEDMAVVGQGATADEAIRIARQAEPHVIVLDLALPGGAVTAVEQIAATCPAVHQLVLTVLSDVEWVSAAMRLGVRGYLLRGVSAQELVGAVRAVSRGEVYISATLGVRLWGGTVTDMTPAPIQWIQFPDLTLREQQILNHVARGRSNKAIASELDLTEKTVKHYLTSILRKLGVRNRVEAALLASSRDTPWRAGGRSVRND